MFLDNLDTRTRGAKSKNIEMYFPLTCNLIDYMQSDSPPMDITDLLSFLDIILKNTFSSILQNSSFVDSSQSFRIARFV